MTILFFSLDIFFQVISARITFSKPIFPHIAPDKPLRHTKMLRRIREQNEGASSCESSRPCHSLQIRCCYLWHLPEGCCLNDKQVKGQDQLKRTKARRKPWRAFPLLQRSSLQESKGNLWTSKQKCLLRLSNRARLPLDLRLPLTCLIWCKPEGFVLHPSDNLEACGHEQPPFPSEGSPFPGHFNQLCPREPFPPDFASGPKSIQHSNRVPEHYVYIGSPKEFLNNNIHSFWTIMAMGDLDVIGFTESHTCWLWGQAELLRLKSHSEIKVLYIC